MLDCVPVCLIYSTCCFPEQRKPDAGTSDCRAAVLMLMYACRLTPSMLPICVWTPQDLKDPSAVARSALAVARGHVERLWSSSASLNNSKLPP